MIKITSLNKIYKSKKRSKCHALRNINLTLDDTGLVFVLGKSGSGKSTLLNLIGGLDNLTSGSIEVDGNNLAKFKEKDFCNYRNTHIGFIFQDYHLIDELTVYENIVLSLNLRKEEDREDVKAALCKVDLAGYEDRYPSELSGGEQQRVAIARAIVKNPRIILADEPTGNLDTHTAKSIVELLKALSKECLILIVSHNVNDANNYADRIIELRKGEIISDNTRNPDFYDEVTLENNKLIYPNGLVLSDNDIEFINKNKNADWVKRTDKFISTSEFKKEAKKLKIENKSLNFINELKLSGKFLKNKALAISLSAFMVAVIMVIMALAQTIIAFDSSEIIATEMSKENQSSLLLNKTLPDNIQLQLNKTFPVKITNEDIQAFREAGYKGSIYPVYNHTIMIRNYGTHYSTNVNHFYQGIFMSETFGTMIVDEEFLTEKFGELEFAETADVYLPYGVYITDYVADCVLAISDKYKKGNMTYKDIVGEFYVAGYSQPRAYVNGIIKTDYREKYGEILDQVKNGGYKTSDLYKEEEFKLFFEDVYSKLGFGYSTNPNFVDAFLKSPFTNLTAFYKLNINGVLNYTQPSGMPYSMGWYVHGSLTTMPNYLAASNWLYTTDIPEIPEGAKYIRVAFNSAIDTYYKVENDITIRDYALLCFDDNEPISKEIMNYHSADKEAGIHLNGYTGEIELSNNGKSATHISDYIEIPEGAKITEFASIALYSSNLTNAYYVFYDENKVIVGSNSVCPYTEIESGSIYMHYDTYNDLFGTEYGALNLDAFVPHSVTLSHYENTDVNNENPLFTEEVVIAGLYGSGGALRVGKDLQDLFIKDFIRPYFLYFDGIDGIGQVLETANTLNFEQQGIAIEGIYTMTKAVDVFVPIFELIAIILCVGVVFILMNFASKMINDKMHDIGILKALGTKNSAIGIIFGLQVILIAFLTCVLATAGYFFFIDLANDVLIESLTRLAPNKIVLDLNFLTFKTDIALENCALIFILACASLVVPMLKIKTIKPVKIIKAKD